VREIRTLRSTRKGLETWRGPLKNQTGFTLGQEPGNARDSVGACDSTQQNWCGREDQTRRLGSRCSGIGSTQRRIAGEPPSPATHSVDTRLPHNNSTRREVYASSWIGGGPVAMQPFGLRSRGQPVGHGDGGVFRGKLGRISSLERPICWRTRRNPDRGAGSR
jgi:hypothetical protein